MDGNSNLDSNGKHYSVETLDNRWGQLPVLLLASQVHSLSSFPFHQQEEMIRNIREEWSVQWSEKFKANMIDPSALESGAHSDCTAKIRWSLEGGKRLGENPR